MVAGWLGGGGGGRDGQMRRAEKIKAPEEVKRGG